MRSSQVPHVIPVLIYWLHAAVSSSYSQIFPYMWATPLQATLSSWKAEEIRRVFWKDA